MNMRHGTERDGLFFYRKIIQEKPRMIRPMAGYRLFEIGYDQGWAGSSMMKRPDLRALRAKKYLGVKMTVRSADTKPMRKREDRLCLIIRGFTSSL